MNASVLRIAPAVALAGMALAMRVRNAFTYPPDWGFDATFNWQYIEHLTRDGSLPHPAASWATSDPPLFFYLSALAMRVCEALGSRGSVLIAVPLLTTAAGLGIVALAVALVRRDDPCNTRRATLAGGLLLFLPAHIQMSVMVNEEIFVALFTALAIFSLTHKRFGKEDAAISERGVWRQTVSAGIFSGLAVLTKLSGAISVVVAGGTLALRGARHRAYRITLLRVFTLGSIAVLAGGWYFVRNQIQYGYIQPFGLPAHQRMFELPPGNRSALDYVAVPAATWTDPQLLNEDLLHSVWGSTYATVWFDGHRYFLPREDPSVTRLGTAVLLLAILPTLAFAVGLVAGARRAWRSFEGPDTPLLLTVLLTTVGFALFTYRNPWYAVIKGTSLLALCLPFSFYASEVLARWTRRPGASGAAVWLVLILLALTVTATSTFDLLFEKTRVPGLPWEKLPVE